ncbi:MAG: glycosyltransferase family 39 protein [Candidatus Marinimicrobia bacterium]|nr:glycosyltransferase family 39 protein [Candidatus Neomarinimicrobiota bacterium]
MSHNIILKDSYLGIPISVWKVILGFTLFRLLLALILPLTPQEAYYWSWSRDLALSYFDHPPLASYSIWLTTLIFGQTIFGIKLAAVLWYFGMNIIWALMIQEMFENTRQTFWTLLALNASIVYELYGFVITPDTPLLFTWAACIFALWKLVQSENPKWWYIAGLFMGLAWLGKYSGIMLVPSVLLFTMVSKNQRKWLLTPHPYLGVLLAILVFSPVLIWNAQHDWMSFAFQGSQRAAGMGQWKLRFVGELFGSQFFILSPYLFVVVFATLIRYGRRLFSDLDDKILLLLSSGLITSIFFIAISFRSLVKMNWLAPAYWSLIILGIYHLFQSPQRFNRMRIGIISSLIFLGIGISVVAIPNVPLGEGNTWSGWKQAADDVEALKDSLLQEGENPFIFSTNYKASSLLKFYLPDQPRTYAQDIIGEPALQFDLWPKTEELRGRSGLLVVDNRREYRFKSKKIIPYFSEVKKLRTIRIENFGKLVRKIDIYLCSDYKGMGQEPL